MLQYVQESHKVVEQFVYSSKFCVFWVITSLYKWNRPFLLYREVLFNQEDVQTFLINFSDDDCDDDDDENNEYEYNS